MKIKVITSYKPGTWGEYSGRGIQSIADQWPKEIDLVVYLEEPKPNYDHHRIQWIDLNVAEPNLVNFKNKHKNDPVACGELQEITGGVRRSSALQKQGGLDKNKGSYLWDAVRFSNKVFCVINAVKNSKEYDYIIWVDADTFTFRSIPMEFLENLLPKDSMVTYLGRERFALNDGGKYPECGFVGYNLKHINIQEFIAEWEELYVSDELFKLLEWHDSFVFWHLVKQFQKKYNISVNDIGYAKNVKGHHVFVNSELGLYMDHMKGKRKKLGSSAKNDLRPPMKDSPANIWEIDYWKKVPPALK
jgi:hypothetical protein